MFMKIRNLIYFPKKTQLTFFRNNHKSSDEYIQRSIIPTNHFQKSLLRLPIPKLENSCKRYLNALKPLLLSDQFEKTSAIVENFKENEGPVLQKELINKDKQLKHTSYISGPWFDMYLRDRISIVLNYNPFLVFKDDPKLGYMNQALRATNFIISAMRFRRSLKENVLEPDVYHLDPKKSDTETFRKVMSILPESISWYGAFCYKAYPLDMSQYCNLMNSTRIPREGKDELAIDESARHVLIIRGGRYYFFDVLDGSGDLIKGAEILAHLKYICNLQARVPSIEQQVGVLTSENRDTWATARQKLLNLGNESQFQIIDSSLFVIVLEDSEPESVTDIGKSFLFGDSKNRWFDKSFSLIVNKNGSSAINFEHSWGDGVAVLRFMNDVHRDTTTQPRVHPDTVPANVDSSKIVKEIKWNVDDGIKELIENAKKKYEVSTSKLDMSYLMYNELNKDDLKDKQISPDSFMQLALQMAYYDMKDETPATYESCSTAAFKHGRTETIRSATSETKSVCRMLRDDDDADPKELYQLMKKCSTVHNQLTKEAALGQGFDRHLLALKMLSEERGMHPLIFKDDSYKFINHIHLSTSSLMSSAISFGGFAPVVWDGFGVGYSATSDFLGCVITSYKPTNDSSDFKEILNLCFKKLHKVLKSI